jgi:hypothetical protein
MPSLSSKGRRHAATRPNWKVPVVMAWFQPHRAQNALTGASQLRYTFLDIRSVFAQLDRFKASWHAFKAYG